MRGHPPSPPVNYFTNNLMRPTHFLAKLFSVLISLIHLGRLSGPEKDLEIRLTRHQISILLRNQDQPVRATRIEKLTLGVIVARLKELTHRSASQIGEFIRLFQLETVLGWRRELVRRKWTFPHKARGGRPQLMNHQQRVKGVPCVLQRRFDLLDAIFHEPVRSGLIILPIPHLPHPEKNLDSHSQPSRPQ
jgi:hypothetical protein